MKWKDVPQDKSKLESKDMRELCYALDDDGNYTTALSSGWEPKTIALTNAIEDIDERIANAKERVLQGVTSPIEYYMEVHKMDVSILAGYVGLWKWRVKRHFKPTVFKKLSERILEKYATVFDISVEQLQHVE